MTSEIFRVKIIKPDAMKPAVFDAAVKIGLDKGAKILQSSFKGTMSTWRMKAPVLIKKGRKSRLVWVDSDIYTFLNDGTRIRWALMSNDWKSKTKPRRLKPGPGGGRVVIAGRRAMQARGIRPRKGIKGRHFDEEIVKRDGPGIQEIFDQEIGKAAKNLF